MANFIILFFALAAGFAAFLNPCGFSILVSYITNYFTKRVERKNHVKNILNGLSAGLIATAGFAFLFLLLGVAIKFVTKDIVNFIPLIDLSLGIFLLLFGVMLYKNISFGLPLRIGAVRLSNNFSFFKYGTAYGLASLGCTLPIFLSVVLGSLIATFYDGILVFLAYSIGMGIPMMIITVAMAASKGFFVNNFNKILPHMKKINSFVLILVGVYLISFQLKTGLLFQIIGR